MVKNQNDGRSRRLLGGKVDHTHHQPVAAWEEMTRLLDRVGEYDGLLDQSRLYIPLQLQQRLGTILYQPWVLSPWYGPCLRVIPDDLWNQYLRHIRRQFRTEESFQALVVRPAYPLVINSKPPRWTLRGPSLNRLGIKRSERWWLCPHTVWLEIWNATTKMNCDSCRLGEAVPEAVRSPSFPDIQTNPRNTTVSARSLLQKGRYPSPSDRH